MYIERYYSLLAVLAFIGAYYAPGFYFTIVLGWTGLSLALVSFAYISDLPWIFRKKSNGRIPLYVRWLFVPFLLGAQLYNSWARRNDTVPPYQQIEPYLYLGCRLFPSDISDLKSRDISAILDVTAEFDGMDWSAESEGLDYLNIPVLDHMSPSGDALLKAVNWIDNHVLQQRTVIVHCALGRGRSVLVMAAYLLKKDPDLTVEQALKQIQGVRTTAGLNKEQLKALEQVHQEGLLHRQENLWLIANPVSGGGKWPKYKAEIIERLVPHFLVHVLETTPETNGTELAKKALDNGANLIVACGGDGTLTEVAQALKHTKTTMGIIPLGTANALAHVLFGFSSKIIPVETACEVLLEGRRTRVDTATCNDTLMLLVTGFGLEQQMIKAAGRDEKDVSGQLAYLQALWHAIVKGDTLELTVQLDDEPEQRIETTSLVIANAAPFTTALAQGGGSPNLKDGLLDVTWLPAKQTLSDRVLSVTELTLSGLTKLFEPVQSEHRRVKSIKVSANAPLDLVVDGENHTADSVHIEMQPASLKLLVPANWAAEESRRAKQ